MTKTTSYTKLPKVPLPNIKETMEKYLDAVVSFISPEDYDRAKRQVRDFLSHEEDVKKIELYLKKRNEEVDNWVKFNYEMNGYIRLKIRLNVLSSVYSNDRLLTIFLGIQLVA